MHELFSKARLIYLFIYLVWFDTCIGFATTNVEKMDLLENLFDRMDAGEKLKDQVHIGPTWKMG